jgi:hypothetical protein
VPIIPELQLQTIGIEVVRNGFHSSSIVNVRMYPA